VGNGDETGSLYGDIRPDAYGWCCILFATDPINKTYRYSQRPGSRCGL
jgi:hypothetical protein